MSVQRSKKGYWIKINSGYMGRLEISGKTVPNIFDISHNAEGISTAFSTWKEKIDLVIFGIMEDKDYKALKRNTKH
jgi:folylpolyglutamate synthase/dihydropteroate synthase